MSGTSAAESQAVRRLSQVMRETSIDASGVARILDRDPKTVQRWLRLQTAPRWEVRELVLALNVVLERLSEVIDPATAEDWLFTPVPAFEYERPVDLIRAGRAREVLNLIDAIGEGVFAQTEARDASTRPFDHLERTTLDIVVYRHTSPAFSPLSGDGARRQGGRWNPPESYPVVYTALDVRTVDLELARATRRAGLAGSTMAARRLATIHVRLSRVLDLTTEGARASLGVSEADLVAGDSSIPRAIGEAAHHLGYEAVLSSSAAGSGQVLAIFVDNRAADSALEVVDVQDGYEADLDAEQSGGELRRELIAVSR